MLENVKPKDLIFNLTAISILLVLFSLGIAYYIDSLNYKRLNPPSIFNSQQKTIKIIGGQTLKIPNDWFLYTQKNEPQFVEKIELLFSIPIIKGRTPANIEVIIQPLRKVTTSALLLDNVYIHKFLPEEIKGPPGLVGKPIKNTIGYIDESVWYDPVLANPFVAKCNKPVINGGKNRCIRTTQISNKLAATYSFDFETLYGWKQFDKQAEKWLRQIDGL